MPAITVLREHPIELSDSLRKVGVRCLDEQMVVAGHQAIRVHHPVEARGHRGQHVEELHAIGVILVDRLTTIAARGHVVLRAFELDAEGTGHAAESNDNRSQMLLW